MTAENSGLYTEEKVSIKNKKSLTVVKIKRDCIIEVAFQYIKH